MLTNNIYQESYDRYTTINLIKVGVKKFDQEWLTNIITEFPNMQ
jgi:hypothetical protein